MKTHEVINSFGVILSLAIAIYAAWSSHVSRVENVTGYGELINLNQMRVVDGCKRTKTKDEDHPKKPWENYLVSGSNCGYSLDPTKWQITVNNNSDEPVAIVHAYIVEQEAATQRAFSFKMGTMGIRDIFSLPINIDANSSTKIILEWPLGLSASEIDLEKCTSAKGEGDIIECFAWLKDGDLSKSIQVGKVLYVELVTSRNGSYLLPLQKVVF